MGKSLLRTSQLKNEQIIRIFDQTFELSVLFAEYKQEIHKFKYWTLKILFNTFQFQI